MSSLSCLNNTINDDENKSTSTDLSSIDDAHFIAPKELLLMYQKMSMTGFKIWACLVADLASKRFTKNKTNIPVSKLWSVLGHRLSFPRLEIKLNELQTTLINKDEYLQDINEHRRSTFQALGPTNITVDRNDEVTTLQYQMMQELLHILDGEDKDMFLIEMNVFRHLRGDEGAEAAKNLILFCTPYVSNRRTPAIKYDELKAFMNKSDMYINKETGEHDTKDFNRKVLRKAQQTVNENQFVNFSIDSIEHITVKKKGVACYFTLSPRVSLLADLSATDIDPTIPVQPKRLDTILENYWKEQSVNPKLAYPKIMLMEILERLHLVTKYQEQYINQSEYDKDPTAGTYQILSVVTAIFQLWIDGEFKKEGSKIYKYALQVFKSPRPEQIKSLNMKYIESRKIFKNAEAKKLANSDHLVKMSASAKRLKYALNRYKKQRYELAVVSYGEEGIRLKDHEFRDRVINNKIRAPWIKRFIEDANEDTPMIDVLRRNSLDYYKKWIINQGAQEGIIMDQTVDDFIESYPDTLRDITFLKLQTNVEFFLFETSIEDINKQFK